MIGAIMGHARVCWSRDTLKNPQRQPMSDIINRPAQRRFELHVDGHVATEHYRRDGKVITLEHTEVPPELGGKGVGSRLVKGVLDQLRNEDVKVIPACDFVRSWIDKHPANADLVQS
jgi:predicted GNAT family acetyltransferase